MSALILTLKLDAQSFEKLDALRRAHFPPERNFVPAHITLFHHLPGERENEIRQTLTDAAAQTTVFDVRFARLLQFGKGVAIAVESVELHRLRQELANAWDEHLTVQDRQKYRAHSTIQNKVAPETAKRLFSELSRTWQPFEGRGAGLNLWRYANPRWQLIEEFSFAA